MMSDVYDWFDRPLEQLKETVSEHKEKLDEGHISPTKPRPGHVSNRH